MKSTDTESKVNAAAEETEEKTVKAARKTTRKTSDKTTKAAKEATAKATKAAKETAARTSKAAKAAAEKVAEVAGEAMEKVNEAVAEAVEKAPETAANLAEKAEQVEKAVKKATPRRTTLKETVYLQYMGREIRQDEITDKVKAVWTDTLGRKASELKSLTLYIKPEENKAYYVINDDVTGSIEL